MDDKNALEVLLWASEYLQGLFTKNVFEKSTDEGSFYWVSQLKILKDAQAVVREMIYKIDSENDGELFHNSVEIGDL